MKQLNLTFEDEDFYKIKSKKDSLEVELEKKVTWEEYIKLIFAKSLKNGGAK